MRRAPSWTPGRPAGSIHVAHKGQAAHTRGERAGATARRPGRGGGTGTRRARQEGARLLRGDTPRPPDGAAAPSRVVKAAPQGAVMGNPSPTSGLRPTPGSIHLEGSVSW